MTFGVVVVCIVWLLIGVYLLFVDPHDFERHFHSVDRIDLETILKVKVFMNEGDNQVRAAHKILRYDPIQKSFSADRKSVV